MKLIGKRLLKKGEKGFTLVELLIVLAILAVLAAVVIPNVTGMFGRGAAQAWETDIKTIQTSAATFYFDIHKYDAAGGDGWNEVTAGVNGHYYPTASGQASTLVPSATETVYKKQSVYLVTTSDTDIADATIWMSLLANTPANGTEETDAVPGDDNSPLLTEKGPYLNEIPKSASNNNYSLATGTYTWIIGQDGKVYGVASLDTTGDGTPDGWYSGFNSTYP